MFKFKSYWLIVILSLAFGCRELAAQPERSLTLLGLTVEGNVHADAGLIIATSGLVVGEDLTGDKIQKAIRQLWELNIFADIKIAAERVISEGIYILIRVKEYPRLEVIEIEGGKKIGKEDLEKAVDLKKGQVIKSSDPVRLKRKLKKLAEEKGFLLADIKVEIRDGSAEDTKTLYIRITEGRKVRIEEIDFVGNEHFTDSKLRRQLKKTKQRALFRTGDFHQDKYQEDLKALIEFYREHGFRDTHVTADSMWYSENRKRMFLQINLEEGSQYYFGDITFTGGDLYTESELRRQILFRLGEVFNQRKYDISVRENLISLFYDQGYIYTQIQTNEIPAEGDTLDVYLTIEPGNQFSIRQINITGNTKTHEKVIRREFVLKPGDTFNVTKLRRSMRNVNILNYFSNVTPDLEDANDREIDLWVKVEEKPTDQANLSVGYSERDGAIGAIGFTAPNLFGIGQRLNLDWNFGQQYGSFSIGYTEPWFLDTETLVGVSLYDIRRRWVDGFSEKLLGGSLRLGRAFDWPDDYFRGDWSYRMERSRYYNFSDDFKTRNESSIVDGQIRISSSITQVITRDSRDFPEFPMNGSVVSLTTELAGGPLGGDDQYHKHVFSTEWYTPLGRKIVLYHQFLFGYLAGLTSSSNDIPLLEQFYMGGSGLSLGTPLRGYDDRMVGPPSSSGGSALGGKSQFKTGLELRMQLVDNPTIYGLAFAEGGNTWRAFIDTDPFNLRRSVGLGLRIYMPMIGLIGLDYGYGMDYFDSTGKRRGVWKPHFQFGRQF
ncbi:MAG: outer membrane protein assembly factor BamA [Calditrichota bacterium]